MAFKNGVAFVAVDVFAGERIYSKKPYKDFRP